MAITYSTNDDIQANYPMAFTVTSRPTTSQVATFRSLIYGKMNAFMGGVKADTQGGLRPIEVEKVNQLIGNYYRRGEGELAIPIFFDDMDITTLNIATDGASGGGGHYSKEVP